MPWFRIILFVVALWLAATGPWFLFVVALVGYVLRYMSPEILLVAIVADSYFLIAPNAFPWYTVATCLALICIRWLQPHLSLYNQK